MQFIHFIQFIRAAVAVELYLPIGSNAKMLARKHLKSGTGQRHATLARKEATTTDLGSLSLFLFLANNIHCTIMPCLILIPDLNALYGQLIYAVSARQSAGGRYRYTYIHESGGVPAHAKLFAI